MEHVVTPHIEKLPEGVYLATSDAIDGLVVQGRIIQETIEIARDVAKNILEAKEEREARQKGDMLLYFRDRWTTTRS